MSTHFKPEDYDLSDEQEEEARNKYIPAISEEKVSQLLTRIKPLIRHEGLLYEFSPSQAWNPFTRSFTWNPEEDKGARVDAAHLPLLEALPTYHTCGYHAVFRPGVAEVLAQIPAELLEKVTAFEVLFGQELTQCVDYPGLYGHKTVTLLYGCSV
jgi:hypothetical protein